MTPGSCTLRGGDAPGNAKGLDGNYPVALRIVAPFHGLMTGSTDCHSVTSASTEISWDAESHLAAVRYAAGANLTASDSAFLVDALTSWIGAKGEPFAVLANAGGLHGTDAAYRARASGFFRGHRDVAVIALFNVSPAIRILTEMFRIGTGVELKAFTSEPDARSWLRTKGFAA